MRRPKVLYVCHNHPVVRPGGGEAYALEAYEAMRDFGEFEPIFLARTGPPHLRTNLAHSGTPFSAVNDDPNQYFLHTERSDFDWLNMTSRDKQMYTRHFRDFLLVHRPDVVHFQHTLYLGNDMVTEVKQTLPEAPILFTLHEFSSICHNNGQLVRTGSGELCLEASPRRCNECFPDVSPQAFFLRKRLIQSHLANVDLFLAPSNFLLERYVDWGIPRDRIRFEEYGRRPVLPVPESDEARRRNRFGFFGQFLPYKGVTVLLRAMKLLAEEDVDAHLWLHGSNLEMQPPDFQDEFNRLVAATADNVTLFGSYRGAEIPRLMANVDWVVIPSTWWENSPLVIQEAFQNGRPVICSDVGGMAEKVTNGVNGLHFRVADPLSLAATIKTAGASPDLWHELRANIAEIYDVREHVAALADLYQELLARTSAGPGDVDVPMGARL